MASAKFLEEALSTDVDESAVSAIVGSLEDQLSTSTPAILQPQNISTSHLNNNNITTTNASAISNGGNKQQQFLQHATIPNGEPPPQPTTTSQFITSTGMPKDGIKLIYPQQQQQQQPRFPNGTITTATTKQLVTLKTSVGSGPAGTGSMPTVVSSMTLGAKPLNNVTTNATNAITLQSLQQLQPGQQGHLLLKTENGQYQLLRVGPAPPQQQGGNQQQQITAAGGTTQTQGTVAGTQQTTYRLQTVPAVSRLNTTQFTGPPLTIRKTIVQQASTTIATSLSSTTVTQNANIITNVSNTTTPIATPGTPIVTQTTPKQSLDNTKEKCRKFLANLLELSSREPKNVEKNVRTLIQELIDTKVEPEEFCDRLERLLNASPQPCLIGFLKKSLPLLRLSLVMKEMIIDGIKPPPSHVVFSVASTPTVTTVVQGMRQQNPAQIRLMAPQAGTVVRPGVQARMATPTTIRGQGPRMITATQIRPQFQSNNVIVPTSQPPALHPVSGAPPLFPTSATPVRVQCVKSQIQQIRQPLQQQQPIIQTISQIPQIRPSNITPVRTTTPKQIFKPSVPSTTTKQQTSQKKFVTTVASATSSSSAAYVPDDDINDVAAMGGVNLAEETQRILGSTEFVGTQIRSCKDELFLQSGPLQTRLRQIAAKEGLEETTGDVVAIVSHATQELLKNLVEKLALITAHRIEIVKTDSRYEVTQDVRGQLKFLEELDRAERKRHDEQERELLLRAAKSRSKNEDPEQAKLKAKAKEMQRAEMEELRQREANLTALQAIGPRKKPRLDNDSGAGSTQVNAGASGSGLSGNRSQIPMRPRLKRANIRDLLCLLEQEKDKCKSTMLYKAYLK